MAHNPITIRRYRDADRSMIETLFDDFQDLFVPLDPLGRIRRQPAFGKSYTSRTLKAVADHNGTFLVAEIDDETIGLVVGTIHRTTPEQELEVIPTTTGRVVELYAATQCRGSGIGTSLMGELEQVFHRRGCDVIRVEVFAPNQQAQSFYQRLGYEARDIDRMKVL